MENITERGRDCTEAKSSRQPTATDRRTVLSRIGGVAGIASLTSVAGCTSLLGGDPLTVAYGPSFRTLQAPVMDAQGYLDELDASVTVKNYREADDDGWGILDDPVEVRFEDIMSVLIKHYGGTGDKVLAANNQNDCALLAGDEFARVWKDTGTDAFTTFLEENDEPFSLETSDKNRTLVWLDAIGVPHEEVKLNGSRHVPSIRRRLQDGDCDGVLLSEPTLTTLTRTDVALEEIGWIGNAGFNVPGGVMTVQDELWKDRPELVKEILKKHARATEDLNERPIDVAPIVSDAFGDELSTAFVEEALKKRTANFVTDPRPITDEMNALAEIMAEWDIFEGSIATDSIIDPSLYAEIS